MLTFLNFLLLIVVCQVLDYVLHESNPMQHGLLHPWRTFLVCWNFWGKTLPCLRFALLLFWGCISYGIYSVIWIDRCTIRILHVAPIMLYHTIIWPIVDYYSRPWWGHWCAAVVDLSKYVRVV